MAWQHQLHLPKGYRSVFNLMPPHSQAQQAIRSLYSPFHGHTLRPLPNQSCPLVYSSSLGNPIPTTAAHCSTVQLPTAPWAAFCPGIPFPATAVLCSPVPLPTETWRPYPCRPTSRNSCARQPSWSCLKDHLFACGHVYGDVQNWHATWLVHCTLHRASSTFQWARPAAVGWADRPYAGHHTLH